MTRPEKEPGMPDVGNMSRETGPTSNLPMSDDSLAQALDISVPAAHDLIDDVTEHRAIDMGADDS